MLHVEIVLKTNNRKRKRVLCMTYSSGLSKKESASSTSVEKKKRNKTCEACEV